MMMSYMIYCMRNKKKRGKKKMDKKMYNRCKILSKIYGVPLYIAWKCRYFPKDIRYIKKYGINKNIKRIATTNRQVLGIRS